MRLSWGQGLAAAFVVAVAAGMLELPSRVLAPAGELQTPINLPQALSPAVVLASTPPSHSRPPAATPQRKPVASHPPLRAQPALAPLPADVASRPLPRRSRPSPAAQEPPLDVTLGRARHLPLPPDDARPRPPTHPAPPTPTPPAADPATPPVTPPAPSEPAQPTQPTQPTTTTTPTDCPPQSRSGNGHEQDHDHTPNGKACGYNK